MPMRNNILFPHPVRGVYSNRTCCIRGSLVDLKMRPEQATEIGMGRRERLLWCVVGILQDVSAKGR